MTRAPANLPLPLPDAVSEPFWTACAARRLIVQQCRDCGAFQHPPQLLCRNCRGETFEWRESGGRGHVFTYTIACHPAMPALSEQVPYVIVVVALDDCGGVLVTSNLVGERALEVSVGDAVRLCWDDEPGAMLPRFELV